MIQDKGHEQAIADAMEIAACHGWLANDLHRLRPILLADRPKVQGRRFVLRLVGPGQTGDIDVVVKGDTTGADLHAFEQDVAGHQFALRTLGAQFVPEILSVDLPSRSVVIRHIPAPSAQDMLAQAELVLGQAGQIMGLCGAWLRRLHAATLGAPRPINPKSMLGWLGKMREGVETRSLDVPRRDLFLKYAAQIPAMAEQAAGQSTVPAVTHGDMHLRNLLICNDHAVGIDFGPTRHVATAHDLAKLLVRYHGWFDPDPTCAPVQAFWRAYGEELAAAAHPAIDYILPIQLLGDWSDIPKRREDRRAGQHHRFQQLQKFAQHVFADEGDRRLT